MDKYTTETDFLGKNLPNPEEGREAKPISLEIYKQTKKLKERGIKLSNHPEKNVRLYYRIKGKNYKSAL